MAYRKAAVTEIEITRTVRAVVKGGFAVGRVEVDHSTGKVVIFPAGAVAKDGDDGPNPCDRLLHD